MKLYTKLRLHIFIIIFLLSSIITLSNETSYIKAKVLEEITRMEINDVESGLMYQVEYSAIAKNGVNKGKTVYIQNLIYKDEIYNTLIKPGDNIILYEDNTNGETEYYIYSQNRLPELLSLLFIFLIIIVLISRTNGIKAVMALSLTVFLIFKGLVPLILAEYSPILLSIVFCIISTIITIIFINKVWDKIIIAILGTSGGVITAGILSYIYIHLTGVTGYINMDVVNFSHMLGNINLKELVAAGIIIGSLGAVMDVSVSITASLYELKQLDPNIKMGTLIKSGFNIGKDIIGTMINTLIFAYLGSSLFTILLFLIQKDDFPIIRVFNTEFIIVEILRALCGSFGIIVTVPITTVLGGYILSKKRKEEVTE